jgi:hypothetical protein
VPENAARVAAQCQGCEKPACVADCPARIDIPSVLRRIEAGNVTGAAQELHRRSPFGGLCGVACPADRLCQQHCYRRSYAGEPVRIAELLRWVVGAAGAEGWPRSEPRAGRPRVAVLGNNLAGLTCTAYLALASCQADVLDAHGCTAAGQEGAQGELEALMGLGVRLVAGQPPAQFDGQGYVAWYQASEKWAGQADTIAGAQYGRRFAAAAGADVLLPAAAVAEGRRAASAIAAYLRERSA